MDLYATTVPPLKRLTKAVPRIVTALDSPRPLSARLAPDGFTGGEHFCVGLGYIARTVLPLTGGEVPDLPCDPDPGVIVALSEDMAYLLKSLSPADFDGAAQHQITHRAGEAELTQNGAEFATLYALPNAHFHVALGYATVRMTGANVGKGDLDGFHRYAPGTDFTRPTH